jgi:hypothetical protein
MPSSWKMLVLGVKRMALLKFRDKNGKLKFVQFDHDSQPREVSEIAKEILEEYGLDEEVDEEVKRKIKTQGISQDDLKMLKG